jgi:GNAT superfamily N-acetyltransferase
MSEVRIIEAHEGEPLDRARELIVEYAETRGFPLSWQQFDEELAGLPGEYAPPRGRLLLATVDGEPVGCVCLRPIDADTCEMKRLYVRDAARGLGVGRLLCERLVDEAARLGYRAMLLDTLDRMTEANALYQRLGFRETEPYRFNPLPDVRYLRLELGGGAMIEETP